MADHEHADATRRPDHDTGFSGTRFLLFVLPVAIAFAVLAFWTPAPAPTEFRFSGPLNGEVPKDAGGGGTGGGRTTDTGNPTTLELPPLAGPQPGLIQVFTGKDAAGATVSDRRVARLFALHVAAGEAPTPFLAPGPFRCVWTGSISLDVWDELSFVAEGSGGLSLTINGKPVLDVPRLGGDRLVAKASPVVRLEKGANKVELTYQAPAQGDAWVRLFWRAKEVPLEPVPPTVLSHDGSEHDRKRDALRLGRELFATQRCARCHQPGDVGTAAMPELAIDAPDLRGAGARLNPAWMAQWIRDPHALRPDATMPKLLHAGGRTATEVEQDAADLAAFLAGGAPAAAEPTPPPEQTRLGGWLFAQLGCLACHGPGSEPGADRAHVELRHVRAKWKPSALVAFLRQPASHYAWIRMPDFKLDQAQAEALAAFVRSDGLVTQEAPPALAATGDAARGQARAQALGCANCHQLDGGVAAKPAAALAALTRPDAGCLAPDGKQGAAPIVALTAAQRVGLRNFISDGARGRDSLRRRTPAEDGERRLIAQRCGACHERESEDSILSRLDDQVRAFIGKLPQDADQELIDAANAAIDQRRPALTYLGEKLHAPWMAQFIAGKHDYRPRPWLRMHMPAFASNSELIARGLASQHGLPGDSKPVAPAKDPGVDLVAIGKELADNTGFNCIQCHGIGPEPAREVFEAPGINLWYSKERLHADYYHRWVLTPLRIDPLTKMPQFANPEGKTTLEAFGGDARKQFGAIWHYLFTVPPPPPGGEKNPKHE